ncbi:E3 ubiquitin- ligase ATL23-like [Olea europaea subsp. europaea]|uniref:E3 ubiquitin- ligase ATL23-like n=1 Tax=Olea europaea subsp. europaea TaxID=158383 RepID=A0A8S0Q3Z7_OLEEU|nr:E3 ubiquitin- ligase ATL23-like [Olea europaea subsp. europaea]
MLFSVFLLLFLPCASLGVVFLLYICLPWCADSSNNPEFQSPVKPRRGTGLSTDDLKRIPKVTGKDLVLGTDCAVCLDDIESDQLARMIPGCNHGFHLMCADSWLSKHPVCPLCRAKIGPELLNPPESNPC